MENKITKKTTYSNAIVYKLKNRRVIIYNKDNDNIIKIILIRLLGKGSLPLDEECTCINENTTYKPVVFKKTSSGIVVKTTTLLITEEVANCIIDGLLNNTNYGK